MRCRLVTRCVLIALAAAASAVAQLQSVEIGVSGLDCGSCAGSLAPRLKRLRGVVSAQFHSERGVAIISLAGDNKVTLRTIRDTLKGLGYTPGDAKIVVTGTLKDDRLSLPHQPDAFLLDKQDHPPGLVRIEGTIPAGTETLRVATIAKQE